jgi:HJR/Mrr/RecB family endonuclease
MNKIDAALDRFLLSVARRSGRTVAAVVLLCYPGIALLLPLALGAPTFWLVTANLAGAGLAALLLLTWLSVQVQAANRRHLVDWSSDLRRLDAAEFEWFVGELFRRDGWTVEETGRQDAPDGNVDLKLSRAGKQRLVQAKRWTARLVPVDEVRELAGTLAREKMPPSDGVFVTLSSFTQQARTEAQRLGMTLLDGPDVYHLAERVRRTEPCPVCGASMVVARSVHGWWLRCVANACTGKRDLGRTPGQALELLLDLPQTPTD